MKKKIIAFLKIISIPMVVIMICAMCVSRADMQSPKVDTISEIEVPQFEFSIATDYSYLMMRSVCDGNYVKGKEYERLRNLKKEYLGMTDNLTYDDLLLLSKVVHTESGSSWLTEEHRQLVASVVINRVNSSAFPNSVYDVVYQKGQYANVGTKYFESIIPSETSAQAALSILLNGSIAPSNVVFQSNFKQGSGVYKTITDSKLGTTYFCYSKSIA